MTPITKIALRRISRNWRKSLLPALALTFSMTMISFIIFFEVQTLLIPSSADSLPFGKFLSDVRICMSTTATVLTLITFLTVRVHSSMKRNDLTHTLGVLTSIGATSKQKNRLLLLDMMLLSAPPVVLGVSLGILPGIALGNSFLGTLDASDSYLVLYTALALLIAAVGILLISLCNFLPGITLKKRAVIGAVKKQNAKASEERHGYRQSQTFRNQSLLGRLAKKSIEYHAKTYNGIALSFASAAVYPILIILIFYHIGSTEVVLDENPFDGIDTAAAVLETTDSILLFLGGCFLALTCIGLMQAFLMARIQITARKESARAYLSIGMTEADVKKMISLELRNVFSKAFVILLFGTLVINFYFKMALN